MDYDDDAIGYPMTHAEHVQWDGEDMYGPTVCGQFGEDVPCDMFLREERMRRMTQQPEWDDDIPY